MHVPIPSMYRVCSSPYVFQSDTCMCRQLGIDTRILQVCIHLLLKIVSDLLEHYSHSSEIHI